MNTTLTLRLPDELCGRIEREAHKNHSSPDQFIIYMLTKTLFYNEAIELVHEKLQSASEMNVSDILNAIPARDPLPGDEL